MKILTRAVKFFPFDLYKRFIVLFDRVIEAILVLFITFFVSSDKGTDVQIFLVILVAFYLLLFRMIPAATYTDKLAALDERLEMIENLLLTVEQHEDRLEEALRRVE